MWLHRADGVEAGGYKKPGEWWWESFSGGVKVQRTDEMEPGDCRWCTARCLALETCGMGPARGSRVLKAEGGAK